MVRSGSWPLAMLGASVVDKMVVSGEPIGEESCGLSIGSPVVSPIDSSAQRSVALVRSVLGLSLSVSISK